MPEYHLQAGSWLDAHTLGAMDSFTQGYIEAALFCGMDEGDEIKYFGGSASFADIAPEVVEDMQSDCAMFQQKNAEAIAAAIENGGNNARYPYSETRAGHDFWLTRNHHGAGFWDRGLGNVGDNLTTAAHAFRECDLYVGDDGKIYI